MTDWISVKDDLPKDSERVLIVNGGYIDIDVFDQGLKDNNLWLCNERKTVTHWMPLPRLPPEEDPKYMERIIKGENND